MLHSRHSSMLALFGSAVLAVSLISGSANAAGDRRIVTVQDADYFGFDYKNEKNVSLEDCKKVCLGDSTCGAFTYNVKAKVCFLKSDFGELKTAAGAVAGRVVAKRVLPVEADPFKSLTFVPRAVLDERKNGTPALTARQDTGGIGFATFVTAGSEAMRSGQTRVAVNRFKSALSISPDSFEAWQGLSRAAVSIKGKDWRERNAMRELATTAALNAFKSAGSAEERAMALTVLGQAFEKRALWRPAINTYKASLAVSRTEVAQAAYERVRAKHGFRMLDYSVDADSATPRICVQFSEDLAVTNANVGDFVRLEDTPKAALDVEKRQICVNGVTHGSRYRLALRPGLPSKVGEVLEKPVELGVYIRDRSPSVRFAGRSYVLPRIGSKGIPVHTINTDAIVAKVYRIGDRNLAQTVTGGQFLDQINGYWANQISSELGEVVWEGEVDVERVLNKEVVTAIPLEDVIKDRKPGTYVIAARSKSKPEQGWTNMATQWFIISDLGLTAFSADDGIHAFVRSLASAETMANVKLRLLARNNEVLATATTDASGYARFDAGFTRGTGGMGPAVIVAENGGTDYAFLDVSKSPFDLSDRGVSGRASPGPMDMFMVTERGVYRPGAAVHVDALLRDQNGKALSGVPITFIALRPDGVEFKRILSREDHAGGHVFSMQLPRGAMQGSWLLKAYADPKGKAITETNFLVEDFVPERLDMELASKEDAIGDSAPITIAAKGRYLFGAPAAELRLEGDIVVKAMAGGPEAYPGYRFGLSDQAFQTVREPLKDLPLTDADGKADLSVFLPKIPATTRMLSADIIVRLRESGGRAIERKLTVPVKPAGRLIGIKPLFKGGASEGDEARFEVVAINPDGSRTEIKGAHWELKKLERTYQWYREDGNWRYESITRTRRISEGTVDILADTAAKIGAPVSWGSYRVEVTSPDGDVMAATEFSAGWYVAKENADTPDILKVALDKTSYKAGETAKVRVSTRFAGKAVLAVVNERMISKTMVDVGKGDTSVDLPVGDDWGAGAYVTVSLYRPMDEEAKRMPARAIGLEWLSIDSSDRTIGVAIDVPEKTLPNQVRSVPLTLTGLAKGEKAYVTLAAVDVGILNLTGYKAPEPEGWFYAQRRLGAEVRDLYGQLIDGMQGTRGRVRSGGDYSGDSLKGTPPTEDPVALFSGLVPVGDDGKAIIDLDLPQFNGTLKLMVVAWTADKVGHGTADLIVRDPVVMAASLPRIMAPGDKSRLLFDLHNTDGAAGAYNLSVMASDEVTVGDDSVRTFSLAKGERKLIQVPVTAIKVGTSEVTVRLTTPEGADIGKSLRLTVRPAQPAVVRRNIVSMIAHTGKLTVDGNLLADLVPGTGSVAVGISRVSRLNVPGLLDALDRYPYGCSEQMTSRALPLLYLNEVASRIGLGTDQEIQKRVAVAITGVLGNQSSSGSFGLWSANASGNDLWLDSYITDFLTRAREKGYAVPDTAFQMAVSHLRNALTYKSDFDKGGQDVAYALYVLARNGQASIGDLRYFADTKLEAFSTPLAKAQLGAALGLYGEQARAQRAFRSALDDLSGISSVTGWRSDYGSTVRDGAALLTLAAETKPAPVTLTDITKMVETARSSARYTSTQDKAWMLLAAHALIDKAEPPKLAVNGTETSGNLFRKLSAADLLAGPFEVANLGNDVIDAVVTVRGVPAKPEPAGGIGFAIKRTYYTLKGEVADVRKVAQNDRFVVVLEIDKTLSGKSRMLVEDRLPGGFEIDNPRLMASGRTGSFSWMPATTTPQHSEFRDDRFMAAFDVNASGNKVMRVAYVVRAVSPGTFVSPPAYVEDMYQPHMNARTATGEIEILGPKP